MTIKEFNELIKNELLPKCFKVMNTKGLAYSGKEDKLGNFKRCGVLAGMPTTKAWLAYFVKHFDAICSWIRGGYNDSEPIEGRIVDAINYLFLLYAIISEPAKDLGVKLASKSKEDEKCECGGEWIIMNIFAPTPAGDSLRVKICNKCKKLTYV